MKYFELDKDEKNILKSVESGAWKSVKGVRRELNRYRLTARTTLGKSRNINIRLSEGDLQRVKAIAASKGLPYQTLISSVVHQYSTKQ